VWQYRDIVERLINKYDSTKTLTDNRTGIKTVRLFGHQARFILTDKFPLLALKHTPFKLVVGELLWMLSGSTNNNDLRTLSQLPPDRDTIWQEWCLPDGSLGPIYQHAWRKWPDGKGGYIDQIEMLIDGLKNRPFSRRHIVSAWNVADLPDETMSPMDNVRNGKMALAPCHTLFQFFVDSRPNKHGIPTNYLSCQLYMRSVDVPLGMPFNIAFYSLLTLMVAHVTNMVADEFIITTGDTHIYSNQIEPMRELLNRESLELPTVSLNLDVKNIFDFTMDDIYLKGYKSHPAIKMDVAV